MQYNFCKQHSLSYVMELTLQYILRYSHTKQIQDLKEQEIRKGCVTLQTHDEVTYDTRAMSCSWPARHTSQQFSRFVRGVHFAPRFPARTFLLPFVSGAELCAELQGKPPTSNTHAINARFHYTQLSTLFQRQSIINLNYIYILFVIMYC